MLKIRKNHKVIFYFLIAFCLLSCDDKRVFDEYKTISGGSWLKNSKISFQFDVNDTLTRKNLFINLRNNNSYEFSNLFLITKMIFPDGKQIIDTLEYDMADKTGKFLGKGFTEIKESKLFYKERIIFPASGTYRVEIKQAMRRNGEINGINSLNGITEVGFRIEK